MVIYFTQYILWNSSDQSTGVGSLSLLQGIFPTLGSSPGLPHCRRILYQLSHNESPRIQEGVGYPFSSRSSWPRNQTQSPALQAESLPTELSGKPLFYGRYSLKMYEQLRRRRHRGNKIKLSRLQTHTKALIKTVFILKDQLDLIYYKFIHKFMKFTYIM